MSNYREAVGKSMDLLTRGLIPFVEGKLRAIHGDAWTKSVSLSFREDRGRVHEDSVDWDAQSLLTVMWDQWNAIFRTELGHFERSLVSELREVRNRWAHQQNFEFDDAFRVLDSVQRLLTAVQAANVSEIRREKSELLEAHVADEVNTQVQRTAYQKNKLLVIALYVFCCSIIVANAIYVGGTLNLVLVSIVVLVFVYLIFLQCKFEPPLLYGPRECRRCHRIIYRKTCPYCEG